MIPALQKDARDSAQPRKGIPHPVHLQRAQGLRFHPTQGLHTAGSLCSGCDLCMPHHRMTVPGVRKGPPAGSSPTHLTL